MRLNLAAVERGIAKHVSRELAERLAVSATAMGAAVKAGSIATEDLPPVLCEALAPGAGLAVSDLELSRCELSIGSLAVTLDASEAPQHPLLSAWLPHTLGEAVAAPFIAGCTLAALAPNQPTQRVVEVVLRGDDAPRGTAIYVVATAAGEACVVCRYGAGDDGAQVTIRRLNGPALALAGWAVLMGEQPVAGVSPVIPACATGAARPANAVIH
jgi:hypothetical protein